MVLFKPARLAPCARRECRSNDNFVLLPATLLQPVGKRRVFDPRPLCKLWPAYATLVKLRQQRLSFFPRYGFKRRLNAKLLSFSFRLL